MLETEYDVMHDYVLEAERALMKTQYTLLGLDVGQVKLLVFKPGGTKLSRFPQWKIEYNPKRSSLDIVLHGGEKSARLQLNRNGVWKGRMSDGTYLELVPTTNQAVWRTKLSDVKYFVRSLEKQTRPKKVLYRDVIRKRFNWNSVQYDINKVATKISAPAAIAIMCNGANPAWKLERTLHFLKQQTTPLPIFCFLDKADLPVYSQNIDPRIALVKAAGENCQHIAYSRAWGRGRQLIDIHRQLLDKMGYSRIIVLPEGAYVTADYTDYIMGMAHTFGAYSNLGTIHALGKEGGFLGECEIDFGTIEDMSISQANWKLIAPRLFEYERLFLASDSYHERPHKTIRRWIRDEFEMREKMKAKKKIGTSSTYEDDITRFCITEPPTTVEAAFAVSQFCEDLVPVYSSCAKGFVVKPCEVREGEATNFVIL